MHADTLYHRMLDQEKAIEEAKAAGLPTPSFAPILPSRSSTSQIPPAPTKTTAAPPSAKEIELPTISPEAQSLLTPIAQTALRERLKTMTPFEREVEERSAVMEATAASETGKQVADIMELKKKRREEGRATAGDTISGWFGW